MDRSAPATAAEPSDSALPARRRTELARLVRSRGQMTVTELVSLFDVSADTIRRDLDFLEARGILARTHGGAVPADDLVTRDAPFTQRINAHMSAKRRIAKAAAALIGDGETLIINGGSTTRAFAAELELRRNLTVVTNNLSLPSTLPAQAVRDIYLLGGHYRAGQQVTIGAVGFAATGSISADTTVIGVGGITAAGGLSTTLLEEAAMIAGMIEASRRTIVLADGSKFGHNAFAHIAPFERVQVIVTDAEPAAEVMTALERADVNLLVASS
jgi:DeoR family transcriptional regulator, fructose operon transcriptional repressor